MTHRENVLKHYGLKEGTNVEGLSKATGIPQEILQEVYNRGVGAFKTNPTSVRMKGTFKKNVNAPMSQKLSKEQWGLARVYSFIDKNPKHDQDLQNKIGGSITMSGGEGEAKKKPQHSGTLYDYPTSELKNLAKEYNLAYYINNVERMTKHELVESIRDHMNWKREQERLDNAVQFSKTLSHVTKNYDKTRDKASPRIRKNYAELKKESPQLQAKMPMPVPKYKGRKDWLHTVGERVKHVSPTVLGEIATAPTPSVSQVLSQFRSMTETQQKQLIASLGLTEAEVLPEGVPALGELEPADEKAVANTVHDVIAEFKKIVMNPEPLVGLVVEPKRDESKLEAFKAKTQAKTPFPADLRAKAYFAGIDSWRYIAIAEALLKRPGMSQQELSNQLKKDGWQVGVSQPNISKLLPAIKKLGLLDKPTGTTKAPETPAPKAEEKKKGERTENVETKEKEPTPEVPVAPAKPVEPYRLPPLSTFAHKVAERNEERLAKKEWPKSAEGRVEMIKYLSKKKGKESQFPLPTFEPHMGERKGRADVIENDYRDILENVRHQVYLAYSYEVRDHFQDAVSSPTAKNIEDAESWYRGWNTMICQPFVCRGLILVAVQATWLGDPGYNPGNSDGIWMVYNYDTKKMAGGGELEDGDINYEIGATVVKDGVPGGFLINLDEDFWPTQRAKKRAIYELPLDARDVFKVISENAEATRASIYTLKLKAPIQRFAISKPDSKGRSFYVKYDASGSEYSFATEAYYPNKLALEKLSGKIPVPRVDLTGGLIIDPVYMSGKHPNGQYNPKEYEAIWDNLPSTKNADGSEKKEKMSSNQAKLRLDTPAEIAKVTDIMRVAQDLSHLLENVNPAEALGWRLIYHEIFEMLERHQGRSPIPATNDPRILQHYSTETRKAETLKQQDHAKQIEGMIFKAIRGLPPAVIKRFNREAENYRIPTVSELKTKVDTIKPAGTKPDDKDWYKPLQGKPKTHGLKELFTPA
jgi:hypothetical protein